MKIRGSTFFSWPRIVEELEITVNDKGILVFNFEHPKKDEEDILKSLLYILSVRENPQDGNNYEEILDLPLPKVYRFIGIHTCTCNNGMCGRIRNIVKTYEATTLRELCEEILYSGEKIADGIYQYERPNEIGNFPYYHPDSCRLEIIHMNNFNWSEDSFHLFEVTYEELIKLKDSEELKDSYVAMYTR